jgi:hypothetical protein
VSGLTQQWLAEAAAIRVIEAAANETSTCSLNMRRASLFNERSLSMSSYL